MSSIVDPQPEQPAADELVAYLDGELPPDECRRVEERLAADADYRQQLRDLDQAWEALDVLPAPKTGDDFARTTMELVTVAAQAEATSVTVGAASARRRRSMWYAAAALAGVLVGFVAALWLLPNRNQALLRDLPAIRQSDVLRLTEDVNFLRQLAAAVPLERLMNDEAAIDTELAELKESGAESLETRQQWVESLSADEKVILAGQAKRFYDLKPAPEVQDRLRRLESDIRTAGPEVERTLLAYGQWLTSLTAGKQDELRQAMQERSAGEQIELVQQLVRQEREQATRRLPAEDARRLREELLLIAKERQAELLKDLRRRGENERVRKLEGPRGALTILAKELRNDEEKNEIRDRLIRQLNPELRDHLESLPHWRRPAQLWKWIGESLQVKVDRDELEGFFVEKLDNEQREQLLSLPPKEMQVRLERLYYATELGFRDAASWWSEPREGGGGQNRAGPGRPGYRPDGPPRERDRDRPGGPPDGRGRPGGPGEFFERDRMQPGPGGLPRPRDGRRPPNRPGPPPEGGPPPRDDAAQPEQI